MSVKLYLYVCAYILYYNNVYENHKHILYCNDNFIVITRNNRRLASSNPYNNNP